MKQTMVEAIADIKQFLERPNVPVSQIIKLLGRERPTTMFGGHALSPHDKRFQTIIIRVDPRNLRKLKSITFECPDNPVSMKDLEPVVGKFRAKYSRRTKETEFLAVDFGEDCIIESFTTKIEGHRFANLKSGGFVVIMPDDTKHAVDTGDIFIDQFVFHFIDREPPAELEAKPPRSGL